MSVVRLAAGAAIALLGLLASAPAASAAPFACTTPRAFVSHDNPAQLTS